MGWLDALPDDLVHNYDFLALCKMNILYFSGQIEAVIPYITALENNSQSRISSLNRGRLYIIQSVLANSREDHQDLHLAKEALDLVKDSDIDYMSALNTYGIALRSAGNLTEAIGVFHKAFRLRQKRDYSFVTIYSLNLLLSSLELNGRRCDAIRLGEDVVAEMIDHHGIPLPLAKVIYLTLGISYYKANDLQQAHKYLTDGVDICRKLSINGLVNGEYILAMIYEALGDLQKALLTIRKIIHETNPSFQPLAAFDNAALEAELLLRRGEFKTALNWVESWGLTPDDKPTLLREQSYFTFVRLLLAQECFGEALHLLDFLESSIKTGQRYSRLITVHILQALTYHLSEDESNALQYLSQALKLAAPEGYYRPFLDEGPRIAAMLPKFQAIEPKFVAELLAAFNRTSLNLSGNSGTSSSTGLIEPLSNREKELLRLVSVGLSNEEIACRLAISLNTTKWHLKNIFQKLEVNSRTRAIAKAKQVNLI